MWCLRTTVYMPYDFMGSKLSQVSAIWFFCFIWQWQKPRLYSASRWADLEGLTGLQPYIWLFGKDNGADYVDEGTQTWPLHEENSSLTVETCYIMAWDFKVSVQEYKDKTAWFSWPHFGDHMTSYLCYSIGENSHEVHPSWDLDPAPWWEDVTDLGHICKWQHQDWMTNHRATDKFIGALQGDFFFGRPT